MYDLVEWAAAQPWCDGTVGMIGISYFAMTQPRGRRRAPAASAGDLPGRGHRRPLRGGLPPRPVQLVVRLPVLGADRNHRRTRRRVLAQHPFEAARKLLKTPALHRKFATLNGEAA